MFKQRTAGLRTGRSKACDRSRSLGRPSLPSLCHSARRHIHQEWQAWIGRIRRKCNNDLAHVTAPDAGLMPAPTGGTHPANHCPERKYRRYAVGHTAPCIKVLAGLPAKRIPPAARVAAGIKIAVGAAPAAHAGGQNLRITIRQIVEGSRLTVR